MQNLKVTFLGTTSLLFDDGEDALLIDGFISRPSLWSLLLRNQQPDYAKIQQFIADRPFLLDRLRYVLVAHSHIDHILDAPVFCKKTVARLVGSNSTLNTALGYGLPEEQVDVVDDGFRLSFGTSREVTVTVVTCPHSPGDLYPGEVKEPLQLPAAMSAFRTGLCYSYHIQWGSQKIFVHPSANFEPGKFAQFQADTVFLGIGGLGKQSDEFRDRYWRETTHHFRPKLIVPIHWDAFWRRLEEPLIPMGWPMEDFGKSKPFLVERCNEGGIELRVPKVFEVFEFETNELQLQNS